MADPLHYDSLLKTLATPRGGTRWQEFRARHPWIDLSTSDLARRNLRGYDLKNSNLSTTILIETILTGANLSKANLSFADLRRANLSAAQLIGADLASANLQDAILMDARLEGAQLAGARLAGANLTGADLTRCDLTGANLQGATLKFARLNAACLKGADVARADLTGAVLDEGAPTVLLNHDQAIIDGRQYCDLKNKRAGASQEPSARQMPPPTANGKADDAAPNGALNPPPAGGSEMTVVTPPADRAQRERLGWRRYKAREADKKIHPAPGANGRGERGPIPHRDSEPDLLTTEGCCEVLEVAADATMEEIIKAFRQKAKIYHPDKVRHLNERLQQLASEEFQRVRVAYERLTRHETRPLEGVKWAPGVPHRATPYDYTIADYEALALANPQNTSILYNLAWKYFDEGRSAEAVAGFQRVLELDPTDADANFNLMIVRLYVEISLPALESR